jgi:excisionase family DNA binding protein
MQVRERTRTMTEQKILFSKRDAAEMLSVSPRTLDYLIAMRELEVRRVGRKVLVPRTEIERFAKRDHATKQDRGRV